MMPKRTHRAEQQLRHMLFLDFLEALVRLSMLCALPTAADLDETGAADAGEFLLAMRANEPKAYKLFLESHRPKFTDPDGSDYEEHAKQPVRPRERTAEAAGALPVRVRAGRRGPRCDARTRGLGPAL